MLSLSSEPERPVVLAFAWIQRGRPSGTWEAAIVAGIALMILAYFLLPGLLPHGHSKIDMTQAAIGPNGPVTQAIKMYKSDMGCYPSKLDDVLKPPDDLPSRQRWHGPYLEDLLGLRDPWDNSFGYRYPSKQKGKVFDLRSFGPDGLNGTADDIVGGE